MHCRLFKAGTGLAVALGALMFSSAARAQETLTLPRPDFAAGYPANRLGLMRRASELIGTETANREGRKLGTIRDLVVDCGNWRVVCALVAPANLYGAA